MLILEIAAGIFLGFLLLEFVGYIIVAAIVLFLIALAVGLLALLVGTPPISTSTQDARAIVGALLLLGAMYWLSQIVRRLFHKLKARFDTYRANKITFDEIVGRGKFQ